MTIHFPDGKTPPFGALVYDSAKDTVLGMIAEDGQVYLTGIQPNQKLTIKWNGGQSCQLMIENQNIQNIHNVICNKE
ncbi:FimD/PapC C-terminal domain-containing protein [Providencia alcalifaciens]|nr:FimD/PapC C-terminal domain-containing protein [Providencia alcalifaciens]